MTDKDTPMSKAVGTLHYEAAASKIIKEHAPLIYQKVRRRLQPATVPLADRLAADRVRTVESLNAAQKYAIERLDTIFMPVHGVTTDPNVEESSPNE